MYVGAWESIWADALEARSENLNKTLSSQSAGVARVSTHAIYRERMFLAVT